MLGNGSNWVRARGLAVGATLLLGGCALESAAVTTEQTEDVEGVAQASHVWGNYHWARTANPFTLKLLDYVDSRWDDELSLASADWNASTVLQTVRDPSSPSSPSSTARKQCSAVSGKIKVCNAGYGTRQWLGLAQIWASGSHITQAVAKMNDSFYASSQYPQYRDNPASWQMVMCQEVAHGFGLGHQDETHGNANLGSCMDYTARPQGGVDPSSGFDYGPHNKSPNAHDFAQLEAIYAPDPDGGTPGHYDATTTVKQTRGAQLDTGSGVEDVGEVAGHDDQGRADTFIRRSGPDDVVVTHVLWPY